MMSYQSASALSGPEGVVYVPWPEENWNLSRGSACHMECVESVPVDIQDFLMRVTAHLYQPTITEYQKRLQWLQSDLAATLQTTNRNLPYDVCLEIFKYCSSSAAILSASKALEPKAYRRFLIVLSKPVWVQYVRFEGIRYIHDVSPVQPEGESTLLLEENTEDLRYAYVAANHLGVMELRFSSSPSLIQPPKKEGVMWRTIEITETTNHLVAYTDGFKVRDIYAGEGRIQATSQAYWPVPTSPEGLRFEPFKPGYVETRRMSSFMPQSSELTGISVCWKQQLVTLHPHIRNEKVDFYRTVEMYQRDAVWVYMPLDDDETLDQIWKRNSEKRGHHALLMKSSKGRWVTMGVHPRKEWPDYTWDLIYKRQDENDEIYYERSISELGTVAFRSPKPSPDTHEQYQAPPVPFRTFFEREFFYSSASLEDVAAVDVCRGDGMDGKIITGMVFRYKSGHRASVGQVQLQGLDYPAPIGDSQALWLGFAKDYLAPSAPFVLAVALLPPHAPDDLVWVSVPWSGTLDWWYSSYMCKMYHDGLWVNGDLRT